jgi:hypothetical protein
VSAIFVRGLRKNIDLQIKTVDSPYMTGTISIEYLRNTLIPVVESNRRLPGRVNKPAILGCDNCACHCKEEIPKELNKHGILLTTYRPHTSHVFQVLDILVFERLNAINKQQVPNFEP